MSEKRCDDAKSFRCSVLGGMAQCSVVFMLTWWWRWWLWWWWWWLLRWCWYLDQCVQEYDSGTVLYRTPFILTVDCAALEWRTAVEQVSSFALQSQFSHLVHCTKMHWKVLKSTKSTEKHWKALKSTEKPPWYKGTMRKPSLIGSSCNNYHQNRHHCCCWCNDNHHRAMMITISSLLM